MRKDLRRVNMKSLEEALTIIGYTRIRQDSSEWRRQQFHLFTRESAKRKQVLTLSMHEDVPKALPPFHRARHKGKALTLEWRKIMEAYQRRGAAKT